MGGVAVGPADDLLALQRLSVNFPMFVSPHGTGCSRYVDVMTTDAGLYVTWEQSQPDLSQPLVMNFLDWETVARILAQ